MAATLVGIFDDDAAAQTAVRELTSAGVEQGAISVARNEPAGKGYMTYGGAGSTDYTTGTSVGDKISNFFDGIFGTDASDDERGIYAESVRRGSTVVVVKADERDAERAADILNRAGAIDIDRRHAQYRTAGYTKFDAAAPIYSREETKAEFDGYAGSEEIALPVIEEELAVGKRMIQRGGVRVHTRITERPAEASVNLREEHVNVERRAVDRTANAADFAAAGTAELNVTAKSEVAVASKEARVVEEIVVGKNISERVETVRDTVKRTDVTIEETGGEEMSRNARR